MFLNRTLQNYTKSLESRENKYCTNQEARVYNPKTYFIELTKALEVNLKLKITYISQCRKLEITSSTYSIDFSFKKSQISTLIPIDINAVPITRCTHKIFIFIRTLHFVQYLLDADTQLFNFTFDLMNTFFYTQNADHNGMILLGNMTNIETSSP